MIYAAVPKLKNFSHIMRDFKNAGGYSDKMYASENLRDILYADQLNAEQCEQAHKVIVDEIKSATIPALRYGLYEALTALVYSAKPHKNSQNFCTHVIKTFLEASKAVSCSEEKYQIFDEASSCIWMARSKETIVDEKYWASIGKSVFSILSPQLKGKAFQAQAELLGGLLRGSWSDPYPAESELSFTANPATKQVIQGKIADFRAQEASMGSTKRKACTSIIGNLYQLVA